MQNFGRNIRNRENLCLSQRRSDLNQNARWEGYKNFKI